MHVDCYAGWMNNAKQIAPYGTWASPVSVEQVAGQTIGLSALSVDGDRLLWLELRPAEGGRTVLVERSAEGAFRDLTAAPFDVATRVHEYGGGSYAVRDGRVLFSNKTDGSVWVIEPVGSSAVAVPRPVSRVAGCRFADFVLPAGDERWAVCVREDHRALTAAAGASRQGGPEAAIVALDLSVNADAAAQDGVVLVRGADFLSSPRPSPGGQALAWIEWCQPDMPWDATRLCVAPLVGLDSDSPQVGPATALMGAGVRESVVQPAWSPEGLLHACSDRSGWWNLYQLGDDGPRPVCPMSAEIGGPHWMFGTQSYRFVVGGIAAAVISEGSARPMLLGTVQVGTGQAPTARRLSLAAGLDGVRVQACPWLLPDGSWAWLRAERNQPSAVMLGPDVVRASGTPALRIGDVSLAEAVAFPVVDECVGGGGVAHVLFYAPANTGFAGPTGERPPLIVISHGGPTSMSTDAFSIRIQWWTTRGFAVADVNYGGSTGYGRAYRQRLEGQWGVVDVGDCVAAARFLAESGRVDGTRMAIRGGSAGGFTTLAALVGSDVFRAGASHYGVADLRLLAGDTHKFEARYLDGLIGRLPEDGAVYDARSPINHVERLSCPVIFFQGLDDKVVPPNQAQAMVAAMRERGVAAALYEFAGEAHGFRRAETIRRVLELELDFYGQVFGFMPEGEIERAAVTI